MFFKYPCELTKYFFLCRYCIDIRANSLFPIKARERLPLERLCDFYLLEQINLIGAEHISGSPGEFGAKMKLKYDFGKRKMELIETITKQDFPNEFHATYTTKGVRNIQQNYFVKMCSTFLNTIMHHSEKTLLNDVTHFL